ncbi:protein phosphatase 2C domain-containing protein, partial [Streptomyces sp. ST2-7A]|uniref:protein phosphatase 2C domain-containing protein n=1 Tax=Streptomyces sp. ST2-7A TaxID=2907214 RepID=UPI001F36D846
MYVRTAVLPADPSRPCEDFAAVSTAGDGGVLVVLDGVTPPVGGDGCSHGVPWFVERLGGALLESALRGPRVSLAECLARAISRVATGHRVTCDLSHPRTPQATVVFVRWSERTVEHLVLCDSVLLIRDPEGGVRPVHDARLETCRARARERVAAERVAFLEGLRNAPDGFPTAAA